MSTITVILEPHADGTVHLPVPEELRHSKIKLVATLERAEVTDEAIHNRGPRRAGSLKGKLWIAPDFDAPLDGFKEYME